MHPTTDSAQPFFKTILDQNFLKWLAIVTMVIDHVSEHLLNGFGPGRAIGRFAFPLFAMFIAYNYTRYYHNRFPGRYLKRLLFFGLLAQTVYLVFGLERLNIMATLSLGLLSMYLFYNRKYLQLVILAIAIALFNHYIYSIEYGLPGVLLPLFLSLGNPLLILFPLVFLTARPPFPLQHNPLVAIILPTAFTSPAHTLLFELAFVTTIILAFLACPRLHPSAPGKSGSKYFFYAFYPAHLALILGLEWWLR
jgi:hypothetical protein